MLFETLFIPFDMKADRKEKNNSEIKKTTAQNEETKKVIG